MTVTSATTPMMRQYFDLKAAHPGTIMLFRCGDFYETYAEDAEEAGRLLNIVVTRKGAGADGMVAMAGVPFHALETYLAKLVRAGRRVAIAEQMEDPALAKGLVRRDVVRVVTPGTAVEEAIVDDRSNNYLVALQRSPLGGWGVALADLSTGFFALTEFSGVDAHEQLLTELTRLEPRELLLPQELDGQWLRPLMAEMAVAVTRLPEADFRPESARRLLGDHFRVQSLEGFGVEDHNQGVGPAGALLQYLKDTQKSSVSHICSLAVRFTRDTMVLDSVTQRSLELVRGIHGGREATLLSVLDRTTTPMGARLLKNWILEPLRQRAAIEARLDAVDELVRTLALRKPLGELMRGVRDIERLVSRAAMGTAGPRDLAVLRSALERLPRFQELLRPAASALLRSLAERIDPLGPLHEQLVRALVDEPPTSIRDGGAIRDGFSVELDELMLVARGGKDFIAQLRTEEADRLGIPGLKIGYNKVFGYYIELTQAQLRQLPGGAPPADFIRKQTLANCERYITPRLKEKEELVLHAEERIQTLESSLFTGIRESVATEAASLLRNAQAIAEIDCLVCLAEVALAQKYVRPTLNDEARLEIQDGRHPVLESLQRDPPFVPNDTLLEATRCQLALITGPNMAGKSTYIRQVALMVLMAHMGSFVPATRADVPLRDRIFTRVGAMDHLARGQSTFLVEMTELSNILRHATSDSLVILDEIGRGTSTYDGLSIAWSVCEYIHNSKGRRPLTLFATHYHELTELEAALPRLRNLSVAVHEEKGSIVFLYRIVAGRANRSYGIHAAQLAGVPRLAVDRASEILALLERGEPVAARVALHDEEPATDERSAKRAGRASARLAPKAKPWEDQQLSLFDTPGPHPAIERLSLLDPNRLTPLEALAVLAELRRMVDQ